MITITKRFTFEASHWLSNHSGQCRRLHGHSYILEVEIVGTSTVRGLHFHALEFDRYAVEVDDDASDAGMILDFADLSKIVKEMVVDVWDHRLLLAETQHQYGEAYRDSGAIKLPVKHTTAELLVNLIVEVLNKPITDAVGGPSRGVGLSRVRLYETATGWAEWRRQ